MDRRPIQSRIKLMNTIDGQIAAVTFMVQSAVREWRTAQDTAMEVAKQILNASSRVEVEKLCQQLEDARRCCVGPWSRLISATQAYADSLSSAADVDGQNHHPRPQSLQSELPS
jgi:hypothetical protein